MADDDDAKASWLSSALGFAVDTVKTSVQTAMSEAPSLATPDSSDADSAEDRERPDIQSADSAASNPPEVAQSAPAIASQVTNDWRIPLAPPPEPDQQPSDGGGGFTGNSDGAPFSGGGQPPEQPNDGGGGMTGNSDGAPFSASGTTPPAQSDPIPQPDPPDDGFLEKAGKVVEGFVDGAIEVVKEIPKLVPHGSDTGPVILVPKSVEKGIKKAVGIPDPDDGA